MQTQTQTQTAPKKVTNMKPQQTAKEQPKAAEPAPVKATEPAPVENKEQPKAAEPAKVGIIRKNVPLPAAGHRGAESPYPWGDLAIGDSFLLRDGIKKTAAQSMAWQAANRLNSKAGENIFAFRVRSTQDDDGNPALGVWRVAVE